MLATAGVDSQDTVTLDDVIRARRTVREFTALAPPEYLIRQVLLAGLHAPYARAAVERFRDGYFRRFFVFRQGSEGLAAASAFLTAKVKELAADLQRNMEDDPTVAERAHSWAGRLAWFAKGGHVPGVTNAPYFVVIAEHRGIPDLGREALAHCLQNMWLKATALRLAFQLISVTAQMGGHAGFCELLGLRSGEWDLMGCALGYAAKPMPPSVRPPLDTVTVWLR